MYPTKERIQELQDRFSVRNGRFFGVYRYKNLNWYLAPRTNVPNVEMEWFCYGDIRDDELVDLQAALRGEEVLVLGWKELSADTFNDDFFGTGGGVWLMMTKDEVIFDRRRNEKIGE